jgi:hypothetical protein
MSFPDIMPPLYNDYQIIESLHPQPCNILGYNIERDKLINLILKYYDNL